MSTGVSGSRCKCECVCACRAAGEGTGLPCAAVQAVHCTILGGTMQKAGHVN